MASWVDVTARLSTPAYMHTASCLTWEYGWSGWEGFGGSPSKTLQLIGGVWRLPADEKLEVICPPISTGGPPTGSPITRLCGVFFDTPIPASRIRVRYQLTSAMVSDAATDDYRLEPKILLSAGQLYPATDNQNPSSVTLFGFGVDGTDTYPTGAILVPDIDQYAEVDTSDDIVNNPLPATGVFSILGSSFIPEWGGCLHSLEGGEESPIQVPPYWLAPLQVWAYTDEVPESDFWTDFVGCKELPT